MNIRPIDLQILIPQASEASKIQHTANQQNAALQHDFANQWQKISQDRQQQVQTVIQPEGGKISEKQEQEKRQKERRRAQGPSVKQQDQASQQIHADPLRGHTIDVKT